MKTVVTETGAGILENTLGFLSIFLTLPLFPGYPILREFSFVRMSGIPVKRLTNSRLFIFQVDGFHICHEKCRFGVKVNLKAFSFSIEIEKQGDIVKFILVK